MTADDHATPYVGLTIEQARDRAREEDRPLRELAPGAMYTMEYVENRINVTVVNGLVTKATAG